MIANSRHAEREPHSMLDSLLQRIDREYREMPGLALTTAQARRLWAVDESTCRAALEALVHRGVLAQTRHGAYVRRDGGVR